MRCGGEQTTSAFPETLRIETLPAKTIAHSLEVLAASKYTFFT
jgi:hypothetical protein